ncbi:MAG: hypothetical protein HYW71_00860 [Candidatus Niyogibacteria bacterium]|nr:hypothetical protein [Candidatus Niyogibacteria bacterium]
MNIKTKIFLLSLFIALFAVSPALAQEETAAEKTAAGVEVIKEVIEDETVTAEELEISEPTLLPDSPFYFLKNWRRGIQSALTLNKVNKTELRARFANEKLLEAEKLAEKTGDQSIIEKAMENYEAEAEKVKAAAESVNKNDQNAERLLNKLTDFQLKRQKLMDRLAEKLPEKAREKVLAAQEKSLEKFTEIMTRLDEPEKIRERLEKAAENQKGGKFKQFKNLEILMKVEEKVPEQAKEAIRRAQENALKRLHGDLSKMSPEDQEKFKTYLEKINGDELKHSEIIEKLKEKGDLAKPLKARLEAAQEKTLEKIEKRIEKIPDEAKKEEYLKRLKNNDLPKLRVIEKLKERLPEQREKLRKIQTAPNQ